MAYAAGAYRAARAELVEAHLAGCPACRALLDEQREVGRILRQTPTVPPDPARRAALDLLIEREAARPRRPSPARLWYGRPRWQRTLLLGVPLKAALIAVIWAAVADTWPRLAATGAVLAVGAVLLRAALASEP